MFPEIRRYQQQLEELFKKTTAFSNDIEIQGQWARYLCIRISGFLEVAVYKLLTVYVSQRSSSSVARFVASQLEGFQNPKTNKILDVLEAFNPAWHKQIESQDDFDKMKNAIVSIVNNRNQIAHGEDVGVTIHRIRDYYEQIRQFIDILEKTIV